MQISFEPNFVFESLFLLVSLRVLSIAMLSVVSIIIIAQLVSALVQQLDKRVVNDDTKPEQLSVISGHNAGCHSRSLRAFGIAIFLSMTAIPLLIGFIAWLFGGP